MKSPWNMMQAHLGDKWLVANPDQSSRLDKMPPMPIIVGVARSGTTLLRLMLDAHSDLAIPPETHFMGALLRLDGSARIQFEQFYKIIIEHHRWPDFQLCKEELLQNLEAIQPFTITTGLRCFYQMYASRFGKKRYGDKTPLHSMYMNSLKAVLPEAHFIHIVRDGRDVALSQMQNFPHWRMERDIRVLAKIWVETIQETHRQAAECRDYMEMRYEDLVINTTGVLMKTCEFLQLPYQPTMEQYHVSARARLEEFADIYSASGSIVESRAQRLNQHRRTATPPDLSCLGRWRKEMSIVDRMSYEKIAGDLLQKYSYEI